MLKRLLAVSFVVLMVSSMAVGPAMAAGGGFDYDHDDTPNAVLVSSETTVDKYDRGQMDDSLAYFGDDGDVQHMDAVVNASEDTPYLVRYDQVDDESVRLFPRVDGEDANNVSAIKNSGDWTTDASATAGSASLTDATGSTAPGIAAVGFSASSQTSGDVAVFTYDNFTVDSDAEKRVPQVIGSVDSLASGAEIQVRFNESDGDYKETVVNSSASASADDVIGTSTGSGYVWQQRLADLATKGSGDGSFDAIDSVEVRIVDGDADLTLVGLDAERKGALTLGETVDSNDETVTVEERNSGGDMTVELTALETMGSEFDDAVIHNYRVQDVRFEQSQAADGDVSVEFGDAPNYAYPEKVEYHARLSIPTAIDLSHSGLSFEDTQTFVSDRYATLRIAEGVGDTEFDNISSDSWTDKSSTYSASGETHVLDDTVQAGQSYVIHGVILLQDGDRDDLEGGDDAGGGGGFWGGSGGNPLGAALNWIVAAVMTVAGGLGLKRAGS